MLSLETALDVTATMYIRPRRRRIQACDMVGTNSGLFSLPPHSADNCPYLLTVDCLDYASGV